MADISPRPEFTSGSGEKLCAHADPAKLAQTHIKVNRRALFENLAFMMAKIPSITGSPSAIAAIRPELFGAGADLTNVPEENKYKCAIKSLRFRREEHALLS